MPSAVSVSAEGYFKNKDKEKIQAMAFRYLSIANSSTTSRQRRGNSPSSGWDRFESILNRLLDLPLDSVGMLSAEHAGEAYGLIQEQLLEYTPPENRLETLQRLSEELPSGFQPIIDYILATQKK